MIQKHFREENKSLSYVCAILETIAAELSTKQLWRTACLMCHIDEINNFSARYFCNSVVKRIFIITWVIGKEGKLHMHWWIIDSIKPWKLTKFLNIFQDLFLFFILFAKKVDLRLNKLSVNAFFKLQVCQKFWKLKDNPRIKLIALKA